MKSIAFCLLLAGLAGLARAAAPAAPLLDDPAATAQDRIFMRRANELAAAATARGTVPTALSRSKTGRS